MPDTSRCVYVVLLLEQAPDDPLRAQLKDLACLRLISSRPTMAAANSPKVSGAGTAAEEVEVIGVRRNPVLCPVAIEKSVRGT